MRLLDHLKIIWKISLIVAVLGATLAGVVVFGTDQLSTTVADFAELSNQLGYLVMHKITLVFALWSMAMVSKTLRVPKP